MSLDAEELYEGELYEGELYSGLFRALNGPCSGRKEKELSGVASADEEISEEVIRRNCSISTS